MPKAQVKHQSKQVVGMAHHKAFDSRNLDQAECSWLPAWEFHTLTLWQPYATSAAAKPTLGLTGGGGGG